MVLYWLPRQWPMNDIKCNKNKRLEGYLIIHVAETSYGSKKIEARLFLRFVMIRFFLYESSTNKNKHYPIIDIVNIKGRVGNFL
ncbi:hypothetical protein GCM10007906_41590 [Vibrio hyugaensis]|uniref:Uncharacterized protein n=1 Tax=Vibrio hyugaensis TaxID=1534743 RepID=A0ABQ5Y6L1_9VIBR|nr:hypothetical protein GCM10007906_41590 [Vibrio hyugaensis]